MRGVGVWARRLEFDGVGEEGVECEFGSEGVGVDTGGGIEKFGGLKMYVVDGQLKKIDNCSILVFLYK